MKSIKLAILSMCICMMGLLSACGKRTVEYAAPAVLQDVTEAAEELATSSTYDSVPSNNTQTIVESESKYDPSVGPIIPDVTWNYDSGRYHCDLFQYNIETGDKQFIFSFSNDNGVNTTVAPNDNLRLKTGTNSYLGIGWRYGEIFSKDLKKVAIKFSDNSSGNHVGWMDSDGNITDISSIIHPASDDFTSRVPKDRGAIFTSNGDFAFFDDNSQKVIFVNPDTLEVTGEQDATSNDLFYAPNGALFNRNEQNYPFSSLLYYCIGATENEIFGISKGQDRGIYKVSVIETEETTFTKITPDSDYDVVQCAYYCGKLAFIATRGDLIALFVLDEVNNIDSVRKVCELPTFSDNSYPNMHTYGAMFWR